MRNSRWYVKWYQATQTQGTEYPLKHDRTSGLFADSDLDGTTRRSGNGSVR